MMVSPSFFTAMGIKAARGLLFDDRDTEAGSQSVVLGATLAKNIFAPTPGPSSAEGPTGTANATAQGGPSGAADPVLGKRVRLNGVVYRVSAVLEPYPSEEGLSISYDEMAFVPNRTLTARTAGGQILVTGQADSISFAAREGADLARAMTSLEAAFVRRYGEGSVRVSARIVDLKRDADRRTKILFLLAILAAASGIAAAVNMYNLMSGRVARRSRDIAIQRAIGASSSRIARQTLLESGIVSGLGALIGALASFPVASALGALVSSGGGGTIHVGARPDIVAATAAGAAVAALLFSLPPAISAGATNIVDALRDE